MPLLVHFWIPPPPETQSWLPSMVIELRGFPEPDVLPINAALNAVVVSTLPVASIRATTRLTVAPVAAMLTTPGGESYPWYVKKRPSRDRPTNPSEVALPAVVRARFEPLTAIGNATEKPGAPLVSYYCSLATVEALFSAAVPSPTTATTSLPGVNCAIALAASTAAARVKNPFFTISPPVGNFCSTILDFADMLRHVGDLAGILAEPLRGMVGFHRKLAKTPVLMPWYLG